jgi:hypothetical protein
MNLHETIHSTFERLKADRTFNNEGLIEYALARNKEVPIQLEEGEVVDFVAAGKAWGITDFGEKLYAKRFNQWQKDFVAAPCIYVYYKDDSYQEITGYMFSSPSITTKLQPTAEGFGKILYYFTPEGRNEWLMRCANIEARQQHGYLSWISNNEDRLYSSGGEFCIRDKGQYFVYLMSSKVCLGKFPTIKKAKEFCEFIRSR